MKVLRRHKSLLAATGVLLATAVITELLPYATSDSGLLAVRDMAGGSAAVVAGVLALSSPVGRRLIVLLIAPAAALFLLYQAGDGGPWSNYSVTGLFFIVPISFAVFITGALFLGPTERILRLIRHGNW